MKDGGHLSSPSTHDTFHWHRFRLEPSPTHRVPVSIVSLVPISTPAYSIFIPPITLWQALQLWFPYFRERTDTTEACNMHSFYFSPLQHISMPVPIVKYFYVCQTGTRKNKTSLQRRFLLLHVNVVSFLKQPIWNDDSASPVMSFCSLSASCFD